MAATASALGSVAACPTADPGGLLVDTLVGCLVEVVVVRLDVVVRLMERYVDVGVSGTGVAGGVPTVMVAEPRPCCPSMPMTM